MDIDRAGALRQFAWDLGLKFTDFALLDEALTHSSFANEHRRIKFNERLEFLGDAVLDLIVSTYFYHQTTLDEGQLTKYRSHFVCEKSLAAYAVRIHLDKVLKTGKGIRKQGLSSAILADAFEAVVGAVFLNEGMTGASRYVLKIMQTDIDKACANGLYRDVMDKNYKSLLQERLQVNGPVSIRYDLISKTGPDNSPEFTVDVIVEGETMGEGKGSTVRQAEQNAAGNACKKLKFVH